MAEVWAGSKQKGGSLLLLLALADFADDEGICWPAVPTLAAKSRIQERQARTIIGNLVRDGEIEIVEKGGIFGGVYRPNKYRVIPRPAVQLLHRGGAKNAPGAVQFPANPPCTGLQGNHHKNHHRNTGGAGAPAFLDFSFRKRCARTNTDRLLAELMKLKSARHEILHPGGAVGKVLPTHPAKMSALADASGMIEVIQAELRRREERQGL